MKFSGTSLLNGAEQGIRRFVIPYCVALLGTVFSIIYVHWDGGYCYEKGCTPNYSDPDFLLSYVLAAFFALPLTLGIDILLESKKIKLPGKIIVKILEVLLIIFSYFYFYRDFENWNGLDFTRAWLIELVVLAFLLFAPYLTKNKINAFWQYVTALLIRFLQAFAYFAVLFLGIVLLLASIDYLFNVTIDEEYYFDVWIFIVGVLSMPFFFAGIPKDFHVLDRVKNYPKALRLLTSYVLTPLVGLYLLVLYAYSGKILFTWQWPDGDTAIWIIAFLCVGVITYFFAYNLKEKVPAYIEYFKKWFFVAAMPLVAVLFMSIYIRISDYGFTESRYFIVAGGVWLILMALYFTFSKGKDLKVLPITLFVVLVLANFGPVSAFSVSEQSQLNRLETLFVKYDILKDGKVIKLDDSNKVTPEDGNSMNSILYYLVDNYGVGGLQPWFEENLTDVVETEDYDYYYGYYSTSQKIGRLIGLKDYYDSISLDDPYYTEIYYAYYERDDFECRSKGLTGCVVNVSNYDYYYNFDAYYYSSSNVTFFVGEEFYTYVLDSDNFEFSILNEKKEKLIVIDLEALLTELNTFEDLDGTMRFPSDKMIFRFDNDVMSGELRINTISPVYEDETYGQLKRIESLTGDLLFNLK